MVATWTHLESPLVSERAKLSSASSDSLVPVHGGQEPWCMSNLLAVCPEFYDFFLKIILFYFWIGYCIIEGECNSLQDHYV